MMSKTKAFFMLFLLAGLAGGVWAMGSRPAAEESVPVKEDKAPQNAVVAYYFHGNFRCAKCTAMEAYTAEALKAKFAKELESGKLLWRPTNIDLPQNAHFIQDYQLVTRALVLVEAKEGKQVRWKNLEKIWQLVGDKAAFIKYVQDETRAFLKDDK